MSFKSGLSKLHSAMSEMYWNAVENNPEMMGFDPENVPQRPKPAETPSEPAAEQPPEKVEVAPTPTAPPMPQPSAVYVVMPPQAGQANVQALVPEGYRLISDEEYNKLKRYKTLYKKEHEKPKNDEEDPEE